MEKCASFTGGFFTFVLVSILLNQSKYISSMCPSAAQFLGRVGVKSYYVNNTFDIDWFEAKKSCENIGMDLAIIENDDELKFLSNATQPGVYDQYYWIGARDSHKLTQLQWVRKNGTEIKVRLSFDYIPENPATCAFIQANSTKLEMTKCCSKYSVLGTLCEATYQYDH